MQTVAEAWRGVPKGMKWFATLDLSASYWQIPVHEESQELLTFLAPQGTEAGRFRWTRLPMGLAISSDRFNRLVEEAMKKEPRLTFRKIMDDFLLFAETFEELLEMIRLFLRVCKKHNLTLAPRKV